MSRAFFWTTLPCRLLLLPRWLAWMVAFVSLRALWRAWGILCAEAEVWAVRWMEAWRATGRAR